MNFNEAKATLKQNIDMDLIYEYAQEIFDAGKSQNVARVVAATADLCGFILHVSCRTQKDGDALLHELGRKRSYKEVRKFFGTLANRYKDTDVYQFLGGLNLEDLPEETFELFLAACLAVASDEPVLLKLERNVKESLDCDDMGAVFAAVANYCISYCRVMRNCGILPEALWKTKSFDEFIYLVDLVNERNNSDPLSDTITEALKLIPVQVFQKFIETVKELALEDTGYVEECRIQVVDEPETGVA